MSILYNEIELKNDLFNKFRNMCFEAAMTDIARRSNPLAHSAPKARHNQIFSLVHGVLESVSGYEALTKALENDNLSIGQRIYLNRLDNLCTRIATEASERVMKNVKNEDRIEKGSKEDKVDKRAEDYVKAAKLSEEELTEFKNSINDIEHDNIGDIIENKVLTVVKNERYAQIQDEMLKNKLKDEIDAINQSEASIDESSEKIKAESDFDTEDDTPVELEGKVADGDLDDSEDLDEELEEGISDDTKEAIDSYLGKLPGNYLLEPTSLFSTILEKSYECLLGVNDKKVLYRSSAVKIATEAIGAEVSKSKFDMGMNTNMMLRAICNNIENFHGVNSEVVKESMNNEDLMDEALGLAIDIYATLEAFYSIGLIEPAMEGLKGFVNQNTEWSKTKGFVAATESMKPVTTRKETFEEVYDQVLMFSKKCGNEIEACNDMGTLESYMEKGNFLVRQLETIDGVNDDMLAFAIESVNDVIRSADVRSDVVYESTVHKMIDYTDDMYIECFNAIESCGMKLKANKNIEKVIVRPASESSVSMIGLDGRGRTVSSYTIPTRYDYVGTNRTQMEFVDSVMEHAGVQF